MGLRPRNIANVTNNRIVRTCVKGTLEDTPALDYQALHGPIGHTEMCPMRCDSQHLDLGSDTTCRHHYIVLFHYYLYISSF